MTCSQARELVARSARGELNPRSEERLDAHLRDCAACRQAAQAERTFDRLLSRSLSYTPLRVDLRPAVMRQIAARPRRPAWLSFLTAPAWGVPRWVPASAGLAACLAAGIVATSRSPVTPEEIPGTPPATFIVTAPDGSRTKLAADQRLKTEDEAGTKVRAPDGTQLTLDERTAVVLRSNRVTLEEGRVFASVTPQKRDFVIATDGAETRVLGTQFAVERRESGSTLVTVLEGAVRVHNAAGEQEVPAGNFTVARAGLKPFAPEAIDAEALLGWAGQAPAAGAPPDAARLAARLDVTRRQLAAERQALARVRKMLAAAGPGAAARRDHR